MDCACSAAINYDINNANTFLADRSFWSVFSGVGHWPTFFINQCGAYVVPKTLWVTVRTGDQTAFIENLIEPSIAAMGYELVRVQFIGGGGKTLQVMVERQDRRPINVDHCAEVSRMISTLLEVDDPVSSAYILEVSSPGIDRPLVRIGDYSRFLGFEARIETGRQINGQRRFSGRIESVNGEFVQIDCGGDKADIPFQEIQKASLVMTDDLIEAAQREAQAAAQSDS